jgi:hypothetical protein
VGVAGNDPRCERRIGLLELIGDMFFFWGGEGTGDGLAKAGLTMFTCFASLSDIVTVQAAGGWLEQGEASSLIKCAGKKMEQ